jgi:hypothetical protein
LTSASYHWDAVENNPHYEDKNDYYQRWKVYSKESKRNRLHSPKDDISEGDDDWTGKSPLKIGDKILIVSRSFNPAQPEFRFISTITGIKDDNDYYMDPPWSEDHGINNDCPESLANGEDECDEAWDMDVHKSGFGSGEGLFRLNYDEDIMVSVDGEKVARFHESHKLNLISNAGSESIILNPDTENDDGEPGFAKLSLKADDGDNIMVFDTAESRIRMYNGKSLTTDEKYWGDDEDIVTIEIESDESDAGKITIADRSGSYFTSIAFIGFKHNCYNIFIITPIFFISC